MSISEHVTGSAVVERSDPTGTTTRIAINGLGRIGRTFLKLAIERDELEVVAVNDITEAENLAYLLRFDSAYGRYSKPITVIREQTTEWLQLGDHRVRLLHERDPKLLPWKSLEVGVVVESTGAFETYQAAHAHIDAGAAHVVLSAPAKDQDSANARTILIGVNTSELGDVAISSNGSCTTNSASPIIQVLDEHLGVENALLNTIHGYTATQRLVDSPGGRGDFRRGRAAAANIVPSSTGAAVAVTRAIPSLANHFDGLAFRVPVLSGSVSAIVFVSARPTTADEINTILETAAMQPRWMSVLATTRDPIVSADIVGDPHGAIVDLSLTRVIGGSLCAVYSWYDNEFGFTNTLLNHVLAAALARK